MSVNKYLPHVYVLPEDKPNADMAFGFQKGLNQLDFRQMQVVNVAGGWEKVLDLFEKEYRPKMEENNNCHVVLLIDFDRDANRMGIATGRIPVHLRERAFILGALSRPEELKERRPYETIGGAMAADCQNNTRETWGHRLLCHNEDELGRLKSTTVYPTLFRH